MRCYIPKEFIKKSDRYYPGLVDRIKKEIEPCDMQTIGSKFEPIRPYRRYKMNIENHHLRVIGKIVQLPELDNENVLCLLDVIDRKCKDKYEDFHKERTKNGKVERLERLLVPGKIISKLKQVKEGKTVVDPLPDTMQHWLNPPGCTQHRDALLLCETRLWSEQLDRNTMEQIGDLIHRILTSDGVMTEKYCIPVCRYHIYLTGIDNLWIPYIESELSFWKDELRTCRFLLGICRNGKPSEKELTSMLKHAGGMKYSGAAGGFEIVPFGISYDLSRITGETGLETWKMIQLGEHASLTLSLEQHQIIGSILDISSGGLPLFISGRAGSGKSTVLYYLFAEYLLKLSTGELKEGRPVFITSTKQLADATKKIVMAIMKCYVHDQNLNDLVGQNVMTFEELLLEHLPENKRHQFHFDNNIGFTEFSRWYKKSGVQKKSLSPELCWHLIRAIIKGYSIADNQNEYDFDDIRKEDRQDLTPELFRQAVEVFKSYNKMLKDNSCWDNQDLVSEVLDKVDPHVMNCCAIFCDEAQDYTRIELRFLFWLSRLSHYDLARQDSFHHLPFYFAGDPLQTIQPTLFRWSSLTSLFMEEAEAAFASTDSPDKAARWKEPNTCELRTNYRSAPAIVCLANRVQLFRKINFPQEEASWQESWYHGTGTPVKRFVIGRQTTDSEIGALAADCARKSGTVFVLPCAIEERSDFLHNDPAFSGIDDCKHLNSTNDNLFSVLEAKGCEFDTVVVYRFGDIFCQRFTENSDEVSKKYFLNILYVAVTRARKRLFIIDTDDGYSALWENLVVIDADAKVIEEWHEHISGHELQNATYEDLGELEMTQKERTKLAEELLDKGRSNNHPPLLRRAAYYFRLNAEKIAEEWADSDRDRKVEEKQDRNKAIECEALALKLEGNYRDSGDLFRQLGMTDEALLTYWCGKEWESFADLSKGNTSANSFRAEKNAVNFMQHSDNPCLVDQLLDAMCSYPPEILFRNETWKTVVNAVVSVLRSDCNRSITDWSRIAERIEEIGAISVWARYWGTNIGASIYCFNRAERYSEAVSSYEKNGTRYSEYCEDYQFAKAKTTSFPECMYWYVKSGHKEEALIEWNKHSTVSSSNSFAEHKRNVMEITTSPRFSWTDKDYEVAAGLLQSSGQILDAYFFAKHLKQPTTAWELMKLLPLPRTGEMVDDFIGFSLNTGDWKTPVKNFFQDIYPHISQQDALSFLKKIIKESFRQKDIKQTDKIIRERLVNDTLNNFPITDHKSFYDSLPPGAVRFIVDLLIDRKELEKALEVSIEKNQARRVLGELKSAQTLTSSHLEVYFNLVTKRRAWDNIADDLEEYFLPALGKDATGEWALKVLQSTKKQKKNDSSQRYGWEPDSHSNGTSGNFNQLEKLTNLASAHLVELSEFSSGFGVNDIVFLLTRISDSLPLLKFFDSCTMSDRPDNRAAIQGQLPTLISKLEHQTNAPGPLDLLNCKKHGCFDLLGK
ncbi:MAG: 3'-5' exonuclease [Geobacteraceae bacterium]|nr:3'-5' exonuclease [Geobacteraceae bacterium]